MSKALTYFEMDVPYCSLVYGTSPCTASVGVTGDQKCFNTRNQRADCQDIENFAPSILTYRFAIDCGYLPADIDCIPILKSAKMQEAVVYPGESIGERSTLSLTFKNCRHGDAGIDKYIIAREYNPFEQGTFWGKFRARNPYLQGINCRLYRGFLGQTLEEMRVDHFVFESLDGPGKSGDVVIKCVDFMRLLNAEHAMAPEPSKGLLVSDISDSATSFDVEPVGIGADYPASGKIAVGNELMTYTRSGDTFTVTRGVGTDAAEHSEGDTVQWVLSYASQTSAYILNDLIVNYSPLDSSYTDVTAWVDRVELFSGFLFSADIVRPTPVRDLANELVEQAGLVVFGDTRNNRVFFDVLRGNVSSGREINENFCNNFQQKDQPRKRFSQVWVYYNQRDIFKNLNDPSNFFSVYVNPSQDSVYPVESIKRIYSRWIPATGRGAAEDVSNRSLSRYVVPPRAISFTLFHDFPISLGQVSPLSHPALEDATGERQLINVLITGLETTEATQSVSSEELVYDDSLATGDKTIEIPPGSMSVVLRELYDEGISTVDEVNDIIFIIYLGTEVGSNNTSSYAIDTGDWPGGVVPILRIYGIAAGAGGHGTYTNGLPGGPCIKVRVPFQIDNQGIIGSGGGAGAGREEAIPSGVGLYAKGKGGGGAGRRPGYGSGIIRNDGGPNVDSSYATLMDGGLGSTGPFTTPPGDGGDLGMDGEDVSPYSGGAAGAAIDGESLVTWINEGDIRGYRIN